MLVRNATFIAFDPVNFARYTVDSSLLPRFFFSLSLFFLSYIRSKGIIGFENLLWISAFSLFHR